MGSLGADAPREEALERMDFTLLVERGVAAEVALAAWCPAMDLLALASTDGQLSVHRLNWQRLWSSTPESISGRSSGFVSGSLITALTWSPDGKLLAVGGADGGVALLCAEDGHVTLQGLIAEGDIDTACYQTLRVTRPAPVASTVSLAAPQRGACPSSIHSGAVKTHQRANLRIP